MGCRGGVPGEGLAHAEGGLDEEGVLSTRRLTKLLKETVLGETTAVVKSWKIDKRIIANMSPYPRHSRHRTKFHL